MKVTIVDTKPAVRALIDKLEHLPTDPPSLYLDMEGVSLSRHGSIAIVQLLVLPTDHVYLIDVFVLKRAAFCTSNRAGTTLRSILESALVPKVFFDVRNDSDALFAHFQIAMAGVHDVQLLEVATRQHSKDIVAGLARCIEKDARLAPEALAVWKGTKQKGQQHFAPDHGGSYEVFHSRPMLPDIVDYCTQDVVYLPILWRIYNQKISAKWMKKVQDKTRDRVLNSQKASYEPRGKDKILSPWANLTKFRRMQRPGNTGAGSPEKKMMTAVAQQSATKAATQTAATQPDAEPQSQSSAGQHGPRRSARLAAFEAVKKTLETRGESKPPPSELNLPMRSRNEPKGGSRENTAPALYPTNGNSKWKCTTCSREMQEDQKEQHLAGKDHTALANRIAAPQPGTVKQKSLPPATVTAKDPPTEKGPTKAKATHKSGAKAKGAGTRGKSRQAAAPRAQPLGLPYPPDYLFIGFQGSVVPRTFGTETSFSYGGLGYCADYGLCDKDCGWCGHCMDGVDI